ncbi:hypothetical protein H2199_008961 [Coniosporium tulheliwenetii]|uniref:Uncharacterized protein n=1 Tax=Coniosporium tulheliwenetii TaxID=3383036 RepID=A0ACC2YGM3_9PEZI|nr:hypothetical protein H2199_008961 [Cladosporium sp. JES 115]
MAPTFLIIGATGNTGRGVVETLPKLLKDSKFSGHRILCQTRSAKSPTAQGFAKLPGVELVEINWVYIDAEWLRAQEVVRVFIASHNEPKHFDQETNFHFEALDAGVEYVVRISTTAANVRPACPAYYPRSHWAVEQVLGSSDFSKLQWTSLQPNVFSSYILSPAAEFIKKYRKTGEQGTLRIMLSEHGPTAIIEAREVGIFASHLLVQADVSAHNKAKYVLNGPEDIDGSQIVKMVEEYIGAEVKDVRFKDVSFIQGLVDQAPEEIKPLIESIKHAPETSWAGLTTASTTSKEVLDIAAPRITPAESLKMLLGE